MHRSAVERIGVRKALKLTHRIDGVMYDLSPELKFLDILRHADGVHDGKPAFGCGLLFLKAFEMRAQGGPFRGVDGVGQLRLVLLEIRLGELLDLCLRQYREESDERQKGAEEGPVAH